MTRADGQILVDTSTFVAELCDDLRTSLLGGRSVRLVVEAESHQMRFARALPIGLIINELVTNAFKYAFPGDQDGTVDVRFARVGDRYELSVSDNGVGVGVVAGNGKSGLGRQLVQALSQQLQGSVVVDVPGSGTRSVVSFPVEAD